MPLKKRTRADNDDAHFENGSAKGKRCKTSENPNEDSVTLSSPHSATSSATAFRPALTPNSKERLKAWIERREALYSQVFTVKCPIRRNRAGVEVATQFFKINGEVHSRARYSIEQACEWYQLKPCEECTVHGKTYGVGSLVFINPSEIEGGPESGAREIDLSTQWRGQILEIRELDEAHIFLRMTYLLRPDDDMGKARGRKPYHGRNELVASNQMAIISAECINGAFSVRYYDGLDEEDTTPLKADEFYWRQTVDVATWTLSDLPGICECKEPINPDELVIQCQECKTWYHCKCLEEKAFSEALEEIHEGELVKTEVLDPEHGRPKKRLEERTRDGLLQYYEQDVVCLDPECHSVIE